MSEIEPNHPFAIAQANLEKIAVPPTASTRQVDEWLEQLEFGNRRESGQAVGQLCTWLHETQNIEDLLENKAQLIRVIQVLRQSLNPDRDIPDFESLLCNQALYRCAQVVPHHIFCEGWNRTENP